MASSRAAGPPCAGAAAVRRCATPAATASLASPLPRVDIPPKVAGRQAYVHDLRLPGMVHATGRSSAELRRAPAAPWMPAVENMRGVLKVVQDGSFLAVIAGRDTQAVAAARAGAPGGVGRGGDLPLHTDPLCPLPGAALPGYRHLGRRRDRNRRRRQSKRPIGGRTRYMGRSGHHARWARYQDGVMTVWTHSQGVYPLRGAIAEMLRACARSSVRCIHMEGSGCYGHNGADDAGADAALLAMALPGRPVRVQWMREDEHAWEPLARRWCRRRARGSAATAKCRTGSMRSGAIHITNARPRGQLAPAWHLATPFERPAPKPVPSRPAAATAMRSRFTASECPRRPPLYIEHAAAGFRVAGAGGILQHLRHREFRGRAGGVARVDPVEFRLRHLDGARARESFAPLRNASAGARYQRKAGRGRGFAFAKYKNLAACVAIACEVEVERDSGRSRLVRAVAAIDSGEAVNPDGIRNQIEGGILQAMSWTLHEAVTFDRTGSRAWTGPAIRYCAFRICRIPWRCM